MRSNPNNLQVGPPLGGFLYSAGGFYLPFVVMGSLTLLMGICIIFGMPDGPECTKRTRQYSVYAYIESVSISWEYVSLKIYIYIYIYIFSSLAMLMDKPLKFWDNITQSHSSANREIIFYGGEKMRNVTSVISHA